MKDETPSLRRVLSGRLGLAGLAILLNSCQSLDVTYCAMERQEISIHVSSIPPLAQKLRVCVKANGQKLRQGCSNDKSKPWAEPRYIDVKGITAKDVYLSIPKMDPSGSIEVAVEALDESGCIRGSVEDKQMMLSGTPQPLPLALAMSDVKMCPLVVEDTSRGTVVVVDPKLTKEQEPPESCVDAYIARFPEETRVTLRAKESAGHHFIGWEDGCTLNNPAQVRGDCTLPIKGKTVSKPRFMPGLCSPRDACWENPTPHGVSLRSIWGTEDVLDGQTRLRLFTAGEAGALFEGVVTPKQSRSVVEWTAVEPLVPTANLMALSGSDAAHVWAVGDFGTVLGKINGEWRPYDVSDGFGGKLRTDLRAVVALSPTDAWAGGAGAQFARLSGGTWQRFGGNFPAQYGSINSLGLPGGGEVYATSDAATLWKFDGAKWQEPSMTSMTYRLCGRTESLSSLWSRGGYTWLGGATSFMLRYVSNGCQQEDILESVTPLITSVFGLPGADASAPTLWAVGSRVDENGATLPAIFKRETSAGMGKWRPDRVQAAGYQTARERKSSLYGLWGHEQHGLWTVGSDGLTAQHRTGADDMNTWLPVESGSGSGEPVRLGLRSVHGAGGQMWAVGDHMTILHYADYRWTNESLASPNDTTAPNLYGVWADTEQLWVVGSQGTVRYRNLADPDPKNWQSVQWPDSTNREDTVLNAVTGDAQHILVVGTRGFRYVIDRGTTPELKRCPNDTDSDEILSAWVGPDRYAVGGKKGKISFHSYSPDCRAPENELTGEMDDVRSLWGRSAEDLWAAGGLSVSHRQLNTLSGMIEWKTPYRDGSARLFGGAAYGNGAIVVGEEGRIIYLPDPLSFKVLSIGSSTAFRAAFGTGRGSAILVGESGAIVRYFPN